MNLNRAHARPETRRRRMGCPARAGMNHARCPKGRTRRRVPRARGDEPGDEPALTAAKDGPAKAAPRARG